MIASYAGEAAQLTELRGLAERGRYRELLEQLAALPAFEVEGRTPLALLAAEANGRLGNHEEATRWSNGALSRARAQCEPHAELRARSYQGAVALERGDIEQAQRYAASALLLARELGDHTAQAKCLNNLGIMAYVRGDPHDALGTFTLALAAYQQAASLRGIAEAHHNVGIAHRALGHVAAARQASEEALRRATQAGDETLIALALTGRAETDLLAGEPDLAASLLDYALVLYSRLRASDGLAEVWRLQAAAARARGAHDVAVRLLDQAAKAARRSGVAYLLAEIERDLGAALEALGNRHAARAARQRALALFQRVGAARTAAELVALIG